MNSIDSEISRAISDSGVVLSWGIIIAIIIFFFVVLIIEEMNDLHAGSIIAALAVVVVICTILVANSDYAKYVQAAKEEIKLEYSLFPNTVMDFDTDTFLVNGKAYKVIKTPDTVYLQDGKDKPYIIVTKVTFKAEPTWYVDKSKIEYINTAEQIILKEVHY